MKYLMIVLCVVLFTTCKKDESKTEKSIIGTWKSTKVTTSVPIDINKDGIKNTDYLKEVKGCWEYTFDFLENGNLHLKIKYSPEDEYGNVDINECFPEDLIGTWEVNDSSTKLYIQFTEGFNYGSTMNIFHDPINAGVSISDNQLFINEFPDEIWDDWTYKIELTKE